jgi:hypothetical protein
LAVDPQQAAEVAFQTRSKTADLEKKKGWVLSILASELIIEGNRPR